ncbi:TonB system transport protein ExbD [Sulfurimonas sp.]|uniref:TonB system transport protein ExbD n=1 Tax=Sulfurimonas sp. TaxID=2022749 RepID=UPI00356B47F0
MPKCRKARKRFDQINVIPFIDIMLVLLVMVLTTATFIRYGLIKVELPSSEQAQKKHEPKEVKVFIKADSTLFFNDKEVSLSALKDKLRSIDKNDVVVLHSDKAARFESFVFVMDILKGLNHTKMYIVTKE